MSNPKHTYDYHPKNERIKRAYYEYLKEVDQKCAKTIDVVRGAIYRFEQYTKFKDFADLHSEQIVAFKKYLLECKAAQTGKPLSKATMLTTVNTLRTFFKWLMTQKEYKSKINPQAIDYFRLSAKDIRIARTGRIKKVATMEQLEMALKAMPSKTIIEQRNRALFAFIALTGARVDAVIGFKVKHIVKERNLLIQDPKEVNIKRSKLIHTFFFPLPINVNGKAPIDSLTQLGMKICKTPEQMKAWSQNFGHEEVTTTFTSYGELDPYQQGEILAQLGQDDNAPVTRNELADMIKTLQQKGI